MVTPRHGARRRARGRMVGPVHGLPMIIEDSLDTDVVITTCGSKGRAAYVPAQDATVVARLRQAGAILLGKTSTPEVTRAGEIDDVVIYGCIGWAQGHVWSALC
jgi:amidase